VPSVAVSEKMSIVDAKAKSFRFACTALLVLSILCSRPWPSIGWVGFIAALAVLAASDTKSLLCRARLTRVLSCIVAIISGVSFVYLLMLVNSGKPQAFSDEVHHQCVKMPADTFEWAEHLVDEHSCVRKCLAFVARHLPRSSTDLTAMKTDNATETWSQPETCDEIAQVVARSVTAMMIGSAVAHLLLMMTAIVVVMRACRLRCAAYKAGVLKRRCACKAACKPAGVVTKADTNGLA